MKPLVYFLLAISSWVKPCWADVIIGSEQWGQPQVIEVSKTTDGNYIFRYCHDMERTKCRFLGQEGDGYSQGQINWINQSLDQKSTLVSRTKPIVATGAFIALIASANITSLWNTSVFLTASDLLKKIFSAPEWQASHYQELKKRFRDKPGEFYVPNIEELADSIFTLLQSVPSYEVSCECQVFTSQETLTTQVQGFGQPGEWAAQLNAEFMCRRHGEKEAGQFAADIKVNCLLTKQPSSNAYRCQTGEFCR